ASRASRRKTGKKPNPSACTGLAEHLLPRRHGLIQSSLASVRGNACHWKSPSSQPELSSDIRLLKFQRLTWRVGGRVSRQPAELWLRGPRETPKIPQASPRSLSARSTSGGSAPALLLRWACHSAMY